MTAAQSQPADLIINASWIIPVVPAATVLNDHSVVVKDKQIIALCPQSEIIRFRAAETVNLPNHALIPGLVNAHGHSAMALMRGIGDDLPLMQWLEKCIWPLEQEFVSREFVQQGSSLAMAEMIMSGTTTFADMYFFPDEIGKVAQQARMRVQLASPVLDFPTAWAQDAEEYISKATRLHDDFRNSEFVNTAFGPHAPYTVSDEPLEKIAMLAEELDVPVHIHLHETAQEIKDALAHHGRRPLQRLADLGLLGPRLLCIHATQLESNEMQLLSEQGASVIHCPESNLKLASGYCEVARLHEQSVNVALGTDGGASNNDLDMFGEMQTAALLAKAVAADASALPAHETLAMATINGARALGMEASIGSLEVGKLADLTAVDLDHINTWPLHNPLSHLVYSAHASQVSHVWCGGQALLVNGELQSMDLALVRQHAANWQQAMQNKSFNEP